MEKIPAEQMPRILSEEDIKEFSEILERCGFENAEPLVREELIPLAKQNNCSLFEAAKQYADNTKEQDTSWYQLFYALLEFTQKFTQEEVEKFNKLYPNPNA